MKDQTCCGFRQQGPAPLLLCPPPPQLFQTSSGPPRAPTPHTAQPRVIRYEPLDLPTLCGKVSVPAPHTLFLHSCFQEREPSPCTATPTCLAHFAPSNFTSMLVSLQLMNTLLLLSRPSLPLFLPQIHHPPSPLTPGPGP